MHHDHMNGRGKITLNFYNAKLQSVPAAIASDRTMRRDATALALASSDGIICLNSKLVSGARETSLEFRHMMPSNFRNQELFPTYVHMIIVHDVQG